MPASPALTALSPTLAALVAEYEDKQNPFGQAESERYWTLTYGKPCGSDERRPANPRCIGARAYRSAGDLAVSSSEEAVRSIYHLLSGAVAIIHICEKEAPSAAEALVGAWFLKALMGNEVGAINPNSTHAAALLTNEAAKRVLSTLTSEAASPPCVTVTFESIHNPREPRTLGPFEWVQLTHNDLCASPDGEIIAQYSPDQGWVIVDASGQERLYTDIVIAPAVQ